MIKYFDKLKLFEGCKYIANNIIFDNIKDAINISTPNSESYNEITIINPNALNHIVDYNGSIRNSKDILCLHAQVRTIILNESKDILLGEYFTLFHNDYRMYDSVSFNFHYDYGFMYSNRLIDLNGIYKFDYKYLIAKLEIPNFHSISYKDKYKYLDSFVTSTEDIYATYFGYEINEDDHIIYEELIKE